MWSAVAAACAVLVVVAAVVLTVRRTAARSERAFERAIEKLDEHLGTISLALRHGIAQESDARQQDLDDLGLTLDLGELLDHLLTKAAVLTGGQSVAIRVKGPGGIPVARSLGAADGSALLSSALSSPGMAQFAAMTVGWTYAADERSPEAYRSALVVPIVEDGVETGAIASYGLAPDTFLPEHVRALQLLAAEAARGLRNARRFAEVEQRTVIDALTGVRNRAGYEFELDREIARARRTGRPLSLAVFAVAPSARIDERSGTAEADLVLRDFAAVLARVARTTDIACRRDESQFAILLPETKNEGAGRFCARVHAEASTNTLSHVGSLTLTAGTAEWRPDESRESFDSRVLRAAGDASGGNDMGGVQHISRVRDGRGSVRTRAFDRGGSPDNSGRRSFTDELADEVAQAHKHAYALAILVIDIDDFRSINEQLGESIGDRVLVDVEARMAECADRRSPSRRIGADEFAVVLPHSSMTDAEKVVLDLQASLESRPPDEVGRLQVSAGITELTTGDSSDSVLDRARQALWQARQAGSGTIVVASANGVTRN